jgi:hypothetical protein
MTKYFCADYSRQAEEDIIGSGTNHQTYILVECLPPWASDAFDSKHVPQNLKDLVAEIKRANLSVRFLLISSTQLEIPKSTKVLIYDKKRELLSNGYTRKEFDVENIEQVAPLVRQYLDGEILNCESETNQLRDILVCTHGRHDKCCAKYGNPFYFQSVATISNLQLDNVRIWKASHFGGHRFAPTMIDFPDGRYYGVLDRDSFKSILTRTGDIKVLNKVYRGWGILPTSIQAMERELILRYGWDWFNYKVAGNIIEQNSDSSVLRAEITFEQPNGSAYTYQAELVKDEGKTIQMKGSCNAVKESVFVKYLVENLTLCSYPEVEETIYSSSGKREIKKHEDVRNTKVVKRSSLFQKSQPFIESQGAKPCH